MEINPYGDLTPYIVKTFRLEYMRNKPFRMKILLLLKFGAEEYLNQLRKAGKIHVRLLTDFKKSDSNKEKFDLFEGAVNNIYISEGILQLKAEEEDQWKDLKIVDSHFNNFINTDLIHSYSLYAITDDLLSKSDVFRIDERMKAFGTHFVVIKNTGIFISAIEQFLQSNGFKYKMGLIEYRDFKISSETISLFNKTDLLRHQNEFRILIKAKGNNPLEFYIGNIEGDCEIYPTSGLEKFMVRWGQEAR